MPAGLPKIELSFMLNADGILKVSAEEKRSGVRQEVEMKPQYGISDEEIKTMLQQSIVHAQEDMDKRSLAESTTEAEQLLYATEKFIKENNAILSTADVDGIRGYMAKLKSALDAKNNEAIVIQTEELNNYSRQFAEQAMDHSIAKALQGKKID